MSAWTYEADPSIGNFAALVKRQIAAPSNVFIACDDGRTFTYAGYWSLAGQLAQVLAANGVGRGGRVVAQVEKSIEAVALFLACARLRAVFVPLNPAYTPAELDYFIGDAGPSAIICAPEKFASVSSAAASHGCGCVLTLDGQGGGSLGEARKTETGDFADAAGEWDDIAAILYTSGTTGRSKGAMLAHGNLASNALTLAQVWRFTPQDVLIHALPVHHTHGLFTATNTVLLSGGTMLFRRKFDAGDVVALMPRATAMMGVPTFYTRLLQHPGLTLDLTRHMRLFVSGSAPLLADTHRRFFDATGHAILERYGMTETSMIASNPYGGERRAGTVGLPLPGVELRLAEAGMIEVRGPNVFKGYWRNPEKTAAEFRADGFFITGDLGHIDENGYLSIVGRARDLIISGGFNVYPKEVENEIDRLDGVAESAVIGLPHRDFGEAVTAIVVMAPEVPLNEPVMLAALQQHLAKFKLPKRLIAVASLPRNAMGKVQKNLLRETYAGLYATPGFPPSAQ